MHLNLTKKNKFTLKIAIIIFLLLIPILYFVYKMVFLKTSPFIKVKVDDPSKAFTFAKFKDTVEILKIDKDILQTKDILNNQEGRNFMWLNNTSYICIGNFDSVFKNPIDLSKDRLDFIITSDMKGLMYGKKGLTQIKKDISFGKQAIIYWTNQDEYKRPYLKADAVLLISSKCEP